MDWRETARQAGVDPVLVLVEVRRAWPHNDQWRCPSRSKQLEELLSNNPEMMEPRVRDAIEQAVRRQAEWR